MKEATVCLAGDELRPISQHTTAYLLDWLASDAPVTNCSGDGRTILEVTEAIRIELLIREKGWR